MQKRITKKKNTQTAQASVFTQFYFSIKNNTHLFQKLLKWNESGSARSLLGFNVQIQNTKNKKQKL